MTTSPSKSSEGRPWTVLKTFGSFTEADSARKTQAEKGFETRVKLRPSGSFDLKVRNPPVVDSNPNKKKKKSKNKGR